MIEQQELPLFANECYEIGNKVRKTGGDYTFEGIVVSVFKNTAGRTRYVVEDDRRCLHVLSHKDLVYVV